jgi:hypothetical protein
MSAVMYYVLQERKVIVEERYIPHEHESIHLDGYIDV